MVRQLVTLIEGNEGGGAGSSVTPVASQTKKRRTTVNVAHLHKEEPQKPQAEPVAAVTPSGSDSSEEFMAMGDENDKLKSF